MLCSVVVNRVIVSGDRYRCVDLVDIHRFGAADRDVIRLVDLIIDGVSAGILVCRASVKRINAVLDAVFYRCAVRSHHGNTVRRAVVIAGVPGGRNYHRNQNLRFAIFKCCDITAVVADEIVSRIGDFTLAVGHIRTPTARKRAGCACFRYTYLRRIGQLCGKIQDRGVAEVHVARLSVCSIPRKDGRA